MKSNRFFVWLIMGILLLIVLSFTYLTLFIDKEEDKIKISVVLNDSMSENLVSLKQGMEQAALDYGVELNVVLTDRMVDIDDELSLVEREIENGAEGILLEPITADGYFDFLNTNSGNVAFCLIRSDITPSNVYPVVETDQEEIVALLSDAFIDDYGPHSDETIAVFYNGNSLTQVRRLEKLKELLPDTLDLALVSDVDDISVLKFAERVNNRKIKAIFTLGAYETETIVGYVQNASLLRPISIYGADYSKNSIYYVDKGIVNDLVVCNEFNMGYMGIEKLVCAIKPRQKSIHATPENILVNRDNLYNNDFERILFPVIQ